MKISQRKSNGFSLPLDSYQLMSWIYTGLCAIQYYIFLFPVRNGTHSYIISTTFSVTLCLLLIIGFYASRVDPTDRLILAAHNSKEVEFQALSAFSQYRCTICEANVMRTSKHCAICNRCTGKFDHHCRWLNNCIGGKNYKAFVLLIIVFEINQLALFIANFSLLYSGFSKNNLRDASSKVYDSNIYYAIIVLSILVIVICSVPICTNGYLIGFHVYLKAKDMTTFEYIMFKRAKAKMQSENKQSIIPLHNQISK
jgi:hypothetical protein